MHKTYVVTPHLIRLVETVQMRVTSYGVDEKYEKLSSNIPSNLELRAMFSRNSLSVNFHKK